VIAQSELTAQLPRELSSFVGREEELQQIASHMAEAPVLTLAGPGGAGKTRLALQAAHSAADTGDFPDGVLLVELASLSEPRAVARSVAQGLRVVEQADQSTFEQLVLVLRPKRLLLVLDNCEHVLPACAELAEHLLRGCPRLRLLATSREPLSIAGEVVFRVPPLRLPTDDRLDTLAESEAGRLFVQRAMAANSGFALTAANASAVAEICRRLDGLPLAMELAAARVAAFAPADIASRLDDAFHMLSGGTRTAVPRQQTLQAAMAWSYDLLDADERLLFERLAVFVGGFWLAGAQSMGDSDVDALNVLPRLVAKSMVQAEPRADGSVRYRMLEPLRQFARLRLVESGALGLARCRLAEYVLELAERGNSNSNLPSVAVYSREVTADADNIRAALDWAEEVGNAELAVRLGAALWFWWTRPDRQWEGRVWLERARSLPGAEQFPFAQGRALAGLSMISLSHGDVSEGARLAAEVDSIGQVHGDDWLSVIGTTLLGAAKAQLGDLDAAEPLMLEALARARRMDQRWIEARCLEYLGTFATARGDMSAAESRYQAALQVARAGLDPWSQGMALNSMADFLRAKGEYEKAGPLYEEALELFYTLDLRRYVPQGLMHNLGYVALARGELPRAAQLFLESGNEYRSVGNDRRGLAECVIGLACTATRAGQLALAARLLGSAEATLERLGVVLTPSNQAEYERGLGELHRLVEPEVLESERSTGRTWTLDDALAAARPLTHGPDSAATPESEPRRAESLTPREYEVAVLLARGLTNRELAAQLVITEKTAKNHVQRVLEKLGVHSRAQLASRAQELGLRT
jgi:predicted ATPase/DNA-binding CsgD family transcriptional regulator/Tfp pilus assembly protein PilF